MKPVVATNVTGGGGTAMAAGLTGASAGRSWTDSSVNQTGWEFAPDETSKAEPTACSKT
jgi:hypothetical protein